VERGEREADRGRERRRGVEAARDAPGAAAAQARAAWAKIRSAAAGVAHYERMHLYRGQLWTRGIPREPGLELALFGDADYEKLDAAARADLAEQLGVDELTARRLWKRGDLAVLARLGGRPAGIAWSASGPVDVPELDRTLRLDRYEAYIHDVFVAPAARGRNVAPSMLEFLALELRQRDVFRAWALIGHENTASVRAFEKASYTPVCDVIHTRIAGIDRLVVRPPDPEARELMGLSTDPAARIRRPTDPGGTR
jgi:ribosomal protein S18 acetylase RimI-like enzyme